MARAIDADALKKALSEAIKDAPLNIQATVEQYIDEAPTLTSPNEWVSVEEGLPEDNIPEHKLQIIVLVLTDGGVVRIKNRTYHPARYYYGKFYPERWDWGAFNNDRITHWMPLPAPPDQRPPEREEDA